MATLFEENQHEEIGHYNIDFGNAPIANKALFENLISKSLSHMTQKMFEADAFRINPQYIIRFASVEQSHSRNIIRCKITLNIRNWFQIKAEHKSYQPKQAFKEVLIDMKYQIEEQKNYIVSTFDELMKEAV